MQPTTVEGVTAALKQHGPAQGAQQLLRREQEAAEAAAATGMYTVFRCEGSIEHPDFCTRVAPTALCFCGHTLQDHSHRRGVPGRQCSAGGCQCKGFRYIPFRPEEVGEWWLPRRKGFNVRNWKARCRCKCSSGDHRETPPFRCKKCACGGFQSDFLCVVCDRHWEDHVTVSETEDERRARGLAIGAAFFPLADHPTTQQLFLQNQGGNGGKERAISVEKSVAIMPTNCGGLGLSAQSGSAGRIKSRLRVAVAEEVEARLTATPRGAPLGCIRKSGCTCRDCAEMAGLTLADVSRPSPGGRVWGRSTTEMHGAVGGSDAVTARSM